MNLAQFIKDRIELRTVRKKLKKIGKKITLQMLHQTGYSDRVSCFPIKLLQGSSKSDVSFLHRIKLVLSNKSLEKRIFLSDVEPTVKRLVKKYVQLRSFSDDYVKDWNDYNKTTCFPTPSF
ncbi:hypothetical protein [Treponema sp.]|uniref:hypothetical protein n=1 Tax=Treponema sp. TaxID=166 RepID=UPI003F102584